MIEIQVKYDKADQWRKLSVGLHDLCPMVEVKNAVMNHVRQYAIDNNISHHMVAGRAIDRDNKIVYYRESNASANHPRNYHA